MFRKRCPSSFRKHSATATRPNVADIVLRNGGQSIRNRNIPNPAAATRPVAAVPGRSVAVRNPIAGTIPECGKRPLTAAKRNIDYPAVRNIPNGTMTGSDIPDCPFRNPPTFPPDIIRRTETNPVRHPAEQPTERVADIPVIIPPPLFRTDIIRPNSRDGTLFVPVPFRRRHHPPNPSSRPSGTRRMFRRLSRRNG